MPRMAAPAVPDQSELTTYEVKKESWMTDGLGHSSLRVPAAEGENPVTIRLHPKQAEYLIHSGQVAAIPGTTRGYPVDAVDGEPLKLSDEERRALPPLGQATEGEEKVLGESSAQEPSTTETTAVDEVSSTQTSGEDQLKPAEVEPPADTGAPTDTKKSGRRSS